MDQLETLKFRIFQYQENLKNPGRRDEIPHDLICTATDLLLEITRHIPETHPVLREVIWYVGNMLKRLCGVTKEKDNAANSRG